MANSFELASEVVRDSAIILSDNLVAGSLIKRDVAESKFAEKVGTSLKVKTIPDLGAANEFTATTSATNVTESYKTITLDKHFYQKVTVTSDEMNFSIDDFNTVIARPMALSIAKSIDSYLIDKMAAGFAQNLAGTAGTIPSTVDAILDGRKNILDNRGTFRNMAGIIGTGAEKAFLQIANFISADYGPERPLAMRDASLGKLHGISWFTSQNCGTSDQGDVAGTVLLNGAGTAGDTSIGMDAFTASTGTIKEGTRFTIAGTSTVYTVTADATIASNAATVSIYPALTANEADNDAITFQTAHTQDLIFNTDAVYGAIIAPKPFSDGSSAIAAVDGLSMRASFFKDHSTLSEYFIMDVYCECKVIHPFSGAVINA